MSNSYNENALNELKDQAEALALQLTQAAAGLLASVAAIDRNVIEPTLTPEEVIEALRISDDQFNAMVRYGNIKVIKITPKIWRVPRAELQRVMAGEQAQSGEAVPV